MLLAMAHGMVAVLTLDIVSLITEDGLASKLLPTSLFKKQIKTKPFADAFH